MSILVCICLHLPRNCFEKGIYSVAAEKQILTGEQTIFLKKALSIEIVVKKGETTEPRVMVCLSLSLFSHSHFQGVVGLDREFN